MFRDHAVTPQSDSQWYPAMTCFDRWRGGFLRRFLLILALLSVCFEMGRGILSACDNDASISEYVAQLKGRGAFVRKNGNGEIITISITGLTGIGDDDLRNLSKIRTMRTLGLDGANVTGEGINHLIALAELERLYLGNANLDAAALEKLAGLQGKRIFLGREDYFLLACQSEG